MSALKKSPVRANPDLLPRHYHQGMWAWILHRLSGLAIVLFLLPHIWEISAVNRGGAGEFNATMARLRNPLAATGEFLLFMAVLYHGINGIRCLLFDRGIGVRKQKALFWTVIAVSGLALVLGASAFLPRIFGVVPAALFRRP